MTNGYLSHDSCFHVAPLHEDSLHVCNCRSFSYRWVHWGVLSALGKEQLVVSSVGPRFLRTDSLWSTE